MKNKEGGFLQIIIIIIIALAIMRYYNVTVFTVFDWVKGLSFSEVIDWIASLFRSAFRRG